MKLLQTFFSVCLVIVLCGCDEPGKAADENRYHFGTVERGAVIEHTFEIANAGAESVTIPHPKVSCAACLSVLNFPEHLEPREVGQVTLRLDTKGKRGLVTQDALVDLGEQEISLTMEGLVEAVWLDKEIVDFGFVVRDENSCSAKGIYILYAGLEDAAISSITCDNPDLELVLEEAEVDEETSQKGIDTLGYLDVGLKPVDTVAKGRKAGEILIALENADVRELQLHYEYYDAGSIQAVPAAIVFGTLQEGETRVEKILLKDEGVEHELAASCDAESLKASIVAGTDASELVVGYTNDGSASGFVSGDITVQSDTSVLLKIPYSAFLMSAAG